MKDCENITFDDIQDTVIRYITKLRERFSDYFPDFNIEKCDIPSLPEEPPGLAYSIWEQSESVVFLAVKNCKGLQSCTWGTEKQNSGTEITTN